MHCGILLSQKTSHHSRGTHIKIFSVSLFPSLQKSWVISWFHSSWWFDHMLLTLAVFPCISFSGHLATHNLCVDARVNLADNGSLHTRLEIQRSKDRGLLHQQTWETMVIRSITSKSCSYADRSIAGSLISHLMIYHILCISNVWPFWSVTLLLYRLIWIKENHSASMSQECGSIPSLFNSIALPIYTTHQSHVRRAFEGRFSAYAI